MSDRPDMEVLSHSSPWLLWGYLGALIWPVLLCISLKLLSPKLVMFVVVWYHLFFRPQQLSDFEHRIVRKSTCPYNKTCWEDAQCMEFADDSCVCFFFFGGCECSLAGICVTPWQNSNRGLQWWSEIYGSWENLAKFRNFRVWRECWQFTYPLTLTDCLALCLAD